MKKLFAVIMSLVFSVLMSSAFAVDFVDTATTTFEVAKLLLDKSGKLIGVADVDETTAKFTLGGEDEEINLNNILSDGKVVRAKGWTVGAELDESNMLSNGTPVEGIIVFTETGVELGYDGFAANDLFDQCTIAMDGATLAYRMLTSDRGVIVAYFEIGTCGERIAIWEADWDNDGEVELCLRAGLYTSKSTSTNPPADDDEDTDFTIGTNPPANTEDDTDFTIGGDGSSDDTDFTIGGDDGWTI